MPTLDLFQQCEIRVGTVRSARRHPSARKPACQLAIDFGDLGIRHSSAQVLERYGPEALVGRQVIALVNIPPRQIGDFTSEVLVLGAMVTEKDVVLLVPEQPVPDGVRIA